MFIRLFLNNYNKRGLQFTTCFARCFWYDTLEMIVSALKNSH